LLRPGPRPKRQLSDEASYVNGATREIDGGALATIRIDLD
jgi:hypothetical protein